MRLVLKPFNDFSAEEIDDLESHDTFNLEISLWNNGGGQGEFIRLQDFVIALGNEEEIRALGNVLVRNIKDIMRRAVT